MSYEFLPDVAVADAAFRATGNNLEELFTSAADALMNVMIDDIATISPQQHRPIHLENEALDMLLFDFLQELIYLKDADQLLLRLQRARIEQKNDKHILHADLAGEQIDPSRHTQRVDVKAVTLHKFTLEKTQDGWSSTVVLDI